MCLAVPGRIVHIGQEVAMQRIGDVEFGGITKQINLSFVPEAGVGDYVLVHVGFAISQIDEAEAARVFEYLEEIDELGEIADSRS